MSKKFKVHSESKKPKLTCKNKDCGCQMLKYPRDGSAGFTTFQYNGVPVPGGSIALDPGYQQTVDYFVNTLPTPQYVTPNMRVPKLTKAIKESIKESMEYVTAPRKMGKLTNLGG